MCSPKLQPAVVLSRGLLLKDKADQLQNVIVGKQELLILY